MQQQKLEIRAVAHFHQAEGLRALRRAALGQANAAEFAEWAVLQGLLPADQLAEFLNG